jgi:hypothetical protein
MLTCPNCANNNIKRYRNCEIPVPEDGQVFHLVRCPNCRLVFTSPKPRSELLARLYSGKGYYSYQKFHIPQEDQATSFKKG